MQEAKETTGRTDGLPLAPVHFRQGRTWTGTSDVQLASMLVDPGVASQEH